MNLDEVLQLQVLKLKAKLSNGPFSGAVMDRLLDHPDCKIELRNMCAKVSTQLYQSLEEVCILLDMSKREFIEAAVSDAIVKAQDLVTRHDALAQGEL